METNIDHFDNLVANLTKSGYSIEVTKSDDYRFAMVTGKCIKGGFCDAYKDSPYIDGKMCFDNSGCFDKYSKCPYSLPIPENEAELSYLLSKMEYLGTRAGYNASNNYEIPFEDKYPRNVQKKWQTQK